MTPDFLRRLDALSMVSRQTMRGPALGSRRAPALGTSVEFSDFRNYSPGDDIRRVDWNAYARLERLFLRLYRSEEDLVVTLLLDTSRSMAWGRPAKIDLARRIAGSLAYIALSGEDRVVAAGLDDDLRPYLPPQSGHSSVWHVWEFLEDLRCTGVTRLDKALSSLGRYHSHHGLAVVITDLLTSSDWEQGLRSLLALRQEVVLLQILAPEEVEPDLLGDWRLVDDEESIALEVSSTPRVLQAYKERLAEFTHKVASFCHTHHVSFLQLRSDVPIDDVVLKLLRRARVVA